MTLTIELSPATQELLTAMASANGQPLQDYASAFLEQAARQRAEEDEYDNLAAEESRRDYERNGGKPYSQLRQEMGLV